MEQKPKRPSGSYSNGSAPERRTFKTRENYTTVTKNGEFIPSQRSVGGNAYQGNRPTRVQDRNKSPQKRVKKKEINPKAILIVILVFVLVGLVYFAIDAMRLDKVKASTLSTYAGIEINWQDIKDANEYEVYKKSNDEWILIKTTDSTSYTDKKVTNGQLNNYRIRSTAGKKRSGYRNVECTYIAPVTITGVDIKTDSITLNWQGLDGAKSYDIYKGTSEENFTKYKRVDGKVTSFEDAEIEEDIVYSYTVVQVAPSGYGPQPKEKTAVAVSTKIKKVNVKHSPAGVVVSWESDIQLATAYRIYRKTEGQKWKEVKDVDANQSNFVDPKPDFGKKTQYKVSPVFPGNAVGEGKKSKVIYPIDPTKKLVALTYDDGPYTPVTSVILDVMKQYDSRCTFFWVGSRVTTYKSVVERAGKQGCEIASHTYDHKYLDTVGADEVKSQISKASDVLKQYGGSEVTLLRPPGGRHIDGLPLPEIMWSVDTKDWSNRNKDQTLANAKAGIYDGSIVLMHDLYPTSAEATKELVPWLIERGYQIVTVDEMFEARGIELKNGTLYYSARPSN